MRLRSLLSLSLVPAALVAQAPAAPSTNAEAEAAAIEKLLAEFHPQEAQAKAAALAASPKPAFDKSNIKTAFASYNQGLAWINTQILLAKTDSALGQWEKAKEVFEVALAAAKDNCENLKQAVRPTQELWAKAVADAKAYKAENEPKLAELEQKVPAERKAFDDAFAAVKGKKVKSEEAKALQGQEMKVLEDENQLATISANLKTFNANLVNAKVVNNQIDPALKDAEVTVQRVEDSSSKIMKAIKGQADEIAKFNAEQLAKKKKVLGNKTWVEAVLRDHENLSKQGTPRAQADFLHRLLVLDPGNKNVQKAIDNLAQGKDPFAPEPKPAKKGKTKKGN